MKRTLQHRKGVFALLLALFLGMGTAYAYDFYKNCSTGQRLYYNVIDATNHYVEITYPGTSSNPYGGYTKPSGNIVLPSSVTHAGITYTVTKIGYKAFGWCDELTGSLSIPNSVITIGESAFDNCYGFSGTLTLGNSVTTIGDNAFRGCGGLGPNANSFTGSLIIPNSVITIGNSAFEGSYAGNNGTDLIIGDNVTTIGNCAFSGCDFTGTLTIGTGVTSIGAGAFMYCSGFTQVNYNATNCADADENDWIFYQVDACERPLSIGSNVERVPSYLFDDGGFVQVNFNATNCTSSGWPNPFRDCGGPLVIGNNVTIINSYMFNGCYGFTSLTLGNSVTTIGDYAFYDCGYKSEVVYPGTPPERYGLTGSLTIPNSVTTIGSNAFGHCYNYLGCTLTIGTGVTSIGSDAFFWCEFSQVNFNATNCSDLTSTAQPFERCTGTLTIGTNVQRIPAHLSKGASFTQVNYNATNCADITSADKPYEGCSGTLSIGSNVQRIPAHMFTNCTGFTSSLTIPYSVTVIGDYAFYGCSGLTGTLTIPNSIASLGDNAFRFCTGFTGSLTLPNSLSSIGYATFYGCTGFTGMLTLPKSVSSIGQIAFKNCSNLTSLKVDPETPPTLGSSVFDNVPKSIPVYVPCSSVEDYEAATGWSEFTNYQCNFTVTVTAVPTVGGSVTGGGTYTSGSSVTMTATPNSNYLFMHWAVDGTVVSCNPSYTFTVSEDTELEAVFMSQSYAGDIIGTGTTSSVYLPCYSFYKYSLTEQIYTAEELDGISTITSISFFNEGPTRTRTLAIYLKHTDKEVFNSTTDWISVNLSNVAFGGSVTMRSGMWTTIMLDSPFVYNGTSNLALVVDDNTGGYTNSPHMSCRTYAADGYQALRIYSDGTNYDPSSPSSYTGVRMTVKNQIMLNRPGSMYDITATSANTSAGTVSGGGQYCQGDVCTLKATANSGYTFVDWADASGVVVSTDANYSFTVTTSRTLTAHFMSGTDFCSLTFDLHDSYGDGWNGNQLVVDFENGMSTKLVVPSSKHDATFTLPVLSGSHVELGWIEGSYIYECSFAVSYTEGEVMYVATDLDANFTYEFDVDCSGQPSELVYLGDHSKANNYYLPSYSFYNYSLSEQIYTAEEIGEAGLINCIAFYNAGAETKTRTYQIYLAMTDKTAFSSSTDWISTSNATLVYDGSVTMHVGRWTPIPFSTPFDYDGVSNLVLIVDDNTGAYTGSPHMSCLVYPTSGLQSLRVYSDGSNYEPTSPSSYTGTLQNVKNQIMLNIASCEEPMDLTVTDITPASANIDWTSDLYSFELQYRKMGPNNDFENGFGLWTTIDADGDGYNWYYTTSVSGHDGSVGLVESDSWYLGAVLTPDNYLVSPQIILGGSISFWASAQDNEWVAEHFGVAVSTTGNTNPANFTTIQEWTMTAKSEGAKTDITRSGNRAQGTWYQYTVDLSAYAGQTGYVAIRHFNSTDMFRLNVDDITVVQPGVNSSWTTNYYAASPYALTGLMPGTQYEVRVRSNCVGDHYSDWVYTTFTTTAICSPEDQCELTFTLTDSYGDGWNGAAIQVFDVATNILLASMSAPSHGLSNSSTTDTYTLAVCDGRELRFEWVSGSYDSECSYTVTDVNGIEVFSGSGAMSDPVTYMVNCSGAVQTVALSSGPNWFSTYVDITLDDLKSALVSEVPSNSTITIKSATQNTVYSRGRWNGTLDWDVANMYIIIVPTDCQISLEGMLLNPAEHPITIVGDGNPTWIGFPFSNSMTVTAAFEGFAVNGDIIKSSSGNAQYSRGRWNGSVTDLEPGQGYIYVSAPGSADRVLSFAQFEYVDLGLPSGLLWATCNVGANVPEEYGDYFAWGETTPKDTYTEENYTYNENPAILPSNHDVATANWGGGWRMPTVEEWEELYNNTTITLTTQNGVNGRLFTAANGNSLFLPAAGYRDGGSLGRTGGYGLFWSGSLYTDNPSSAWFFYFISNDFGMNGDHRYYGQSVRPVRSSGQN